MTRRKENGKAPSAKWLSERYVQHNPNGRPGRDGIMAFFTRTRPRTESCGKLDQHWAPATIAAP